MNDKNINEQFERITKIINDKFSDLNCEIYDLQYSNNSLKEKLISLQKMISVIESDLSSIKNNISYIQNYQGK